MMDGLFWQHMALAFLQLAVVVVILKMEYDRQSVAMFFWLATLVIYVIPFFGDAFIESAQINQWAPIVRLAGNEALLYCALFAIGFNTIYMLVRWFFSSSRGGRVSPGDWPDYINHHELARRVDWVLLALLVLSVGLATIAIVGRSGISGLLTASYGSYRIDAMPKVKMAGYLISMCCGASIFFAWSQRRWSHLFIAAALLFFLFLLGRTRQLLLPAMVPFIFYILYRYRGVRGRMMIATYVTLGYGAVLFLQVFRYRGGLMDCLMALGDPQLYHDFLQACFQGKGESLARLVFYYYMQPGVQLDGFMEGLTYQRLMWLPVPTALAGGLKPGDFTAELYYEFYWLFDDIGPSIHPLMYGDAFTNFGWYGMLLGGFWAMVVNGVDALLHRQTTMLRILLSPVLGFSAMMIARGAVYNSCSVSFWVTIGVTLMFFTIRSRTPLAKPGGAPAAAGPHRSRRTRLVPRASR